jgi:hypothetical protein
VILKVSGLRRVVRSMDGIPGDATIDLTRLCQRGSAIVYDPEDCTYLDVRLDLEDLADDQ